MKKRLFYNQILGLCAMGLIGLSSCVDSDYDLSQDVDMNVTIGGDLTVPGSNTDDITLKKIFDLEDDCIVKADAKTGDYFLIKDADPSDSEVEVEGVHIKSDEIDIEESVTNLQFNYRPDYAPNTPIEEEVNQTSSFKINKNDVTKDLVKLNATSMKMNSKLALNFENNNHLAKLTLRKGFKLIFPAYMTIESNDSRCKVVDNHTLTFVQDITVARNSRVNIDVRVVYMDFTKTTNQGLVEIGKFAITDEILVQGTAYVANKDLSAGDVNVNFVSAVEIDHVDLVEVNAVVDPEIDINVNPINIDNLPDFLTDDEVRVQLTDPRIYLTVTNESPVSVNFIADLVPVKGGNVISGNTVTIGSKTAGANQIIIPGNKKNYRICVHQTTSSEGIDADKFVVVPGLNKIVQQIPDQIKVENTVAKALPENVTLKVNSVYDVHTDYKVNAPLQLNEGTKIIYSDNMDGWIDDLEDIDIKQANITMKAKNTIPLDMDLTIDPINEAGEILNNVKVTIVKGKVTAGSKDAPVESDLEITLQASNSAFKTLDGIKYRVSAVTDAKYNGINLNENQKLVLDNIKVKVIGGVTVDLN